MLPSHRPGQQEIEIGIRRTVFDPGDIIRVFGTGGSGDAVRLERALGPDRGRFRGAVVTSRKIIRQILTGSSARTEVAARTGRSTVEAARSAVLEPLISEAPVAFPTIKGPLIGGPGQNQFLESDDMATTFTDVLVDFAGEFLKQEFLETPRSSGPVGPVVTEVIRKTGPIVKKLLGDKKKRKRRRRLLTPTDLSDLAALKTITGNTDALKFAVIKAVRK